MIPRSEIRAGMQVNYCPRADICVPVEVVGFNGLHITVRFSDQATKYVLPVDLQHRKRPSAKRKWALRSVVNEYEAAGGVVKVGERDRLRKAEGGE